MLDAICQRLRVIWWDEQPGDTLHYSFFASRDVGRNDGLTAGASLVKHQAEPFGIEYRAIFTLLRSKYENITAL